MELDRSTATVVAVVVVLAVGGCTGAPEVEGPGPTSSPTGGPTASPTGGPTSSAIGGPTASATDEALGAGTEVLFDGTRTSLDGWRQAGPGSFELADGAITTRGGMGLLWYAERPFTDVVVELEWRTEEATDNSGVFVALGDPGEDMLAAMRVGHEVQIYDAATGEPQKTGAIYDAQPAGAANSRPPGEWNHERITVEGGRITVELNGEVVTEWTDPDGPHEGFIGLQNHSDADVVSYRDVTARPLG